MTSSLVTAGATWLLGTGTMAVATTIVGRGTVTAFAAVAGVIVGSFLNVVVYRVPRGLSVAAPPSFCPHCETRVRPVDNIPVVSWLVLRGRCRQCRAPISVRYPLVESATGIAFAAIGWGLGPHWAVAGYCVLAATLVALVAIERDGLAPTLSVAVVGTAIAVALLVAAGVADRRWSHVVGVVTGVVVAGALVAATRHRPRRVDPSPWWAAAPVLLPVGAALGWLGPAYAGEGLAGTAVVLLALRGVRAAPASPSPGQGGAVLALALAAGVVVATAVAVAVGAGAGS